MPVKVTDIGLTYRDEHGNIHEYERGAILKDKELDDFAPCVHDKLEAVPTDIPEYKEKVGEPKPEAKPELPKDYRKAVFATALDNIPMAEMVDGKVTHTLLNKHLDDREQKFTKKEFDEFMKSFK